MILVHDLLAVELRDSILKLAMVLNLNFNGM